MVEKNYFYHYQKNKSRPSPCKVDMITYTPQSMTGVQKENYMFDYQIYMRPFIYIGSACFTLSRTLLIMSVTRKFFEDCFALIIYCIPNPLLLVIPLFSRNFKFLPATHTLPQTNLSSKCTGKQGLLFLLPSKEYIRYGKSFSPLFVRILTFYSLGNTVVFILAISFPPCRSLVK